jgi:hypothetical protein
MSRFGRWAEIRAIPAPFSLLNIATGAKSALTESTLSTFRESARRILDTQATNAISAMRARKRPAG